MSGKDKKVKEKKKSKKKEKPLNSSPERTIETRYDCDYSPEEIRVIHE